MITDEITPQIPDQDIPETASPETSSEPEPAIAHDGIGLSLEEVRGLLMQKNNEVVGLDDPILMQVTIFNAFLGEVEKVNARHHNALLAIMSASTDKYVQSVKNSVDTLTTELSSASVEAIKKVMQQEEIRRLKHSQAIKWTALIITVSALANVACFALGAIQ